MLNLSLPGRVFLCTLPTDMRKSFDSLAGLVEQQLGQDPLAGDLFVFVSVRPRHPPAGLAADRLGGAGSAVAQAQRVPVE
jgi:transposase